ncbi:MAG: hypothetical protein EUB_01581 [Eubacterium sp.]|uniref:hypothetical protein n=1 Tax=Eubacterium sp. TaxID=142586 RepID=UPI0030580F9A
MMQNESSLVCGMCHAKGEFERTNSFEVYPEGWTQLSGMDICPECSTGIKGQLDFFNKACLDMTNALLEK